MDRIISQIIAIEDMAQDVMNEARTQEDTLEQAIGETVSQKQQEIEKKIALKEEKIRQLEQEMADHKIEAIKQSLSGELSKMEQKYQEHKAVWVENIFNHIINR